VTVALPTDTGLLSKVRSGLWPAPDCSIARRADPALSESTRPPVSARQRVAPLGKSAKSAEPVRAWPGVIWSTRQSGEWSIRWSVIW